MIFSQNHNKRFQVIRQDIHNGLDKIHSNEKVVNGYYVTEVEKQLKELSKRKYALLVTSGSHAITIALQANGLKHGDAVIVTNYSCPASLSSVMVGGFEPVFCEINEHGNMDPAYLPSLMNPKIKAVVATALYGDMHDHDAVKKFCDDNGLVYVNDAAQSQFALCNGIDSLACGDTVAISFADNKAIPTIGTKPAYSKWNGHKYSLFVADKLWSHDKLNEMGVQTERHYLDNFASLDWTPNSTFNFAVTDRFVKQSLTIPNNPHMTNEDVDFVIDCVLKHQK